MHQSDNYMIHLNIMTSIPSYFFVDDYELLFPSFQLHILMDVNHHTYIELVWLAGSFEIFFSQPIRVEVHYIFRSN
jgi:hypothetical protein